MGSCKRGARGGEWQRCRGKLGKMGWRFEDEFGEGKGFAAREGEAEDCADELYSFAGRQPLDYDFRRIMNDNFYSAQLSSQILRSNLIVHIQVLRRMHISIHYRPLCP